MSGYALIYDGAGVDSTCRTAAYNKVKDLIDDRSYRVEYFSQAPKAIEDSRSNPVRLFVIPGGIYTQMADELKPLGPRIRQLVVEEGTSYLGICAGAIAAACQPLLWYTYPIYPDRMNPRQIMEEFPDVQGQMHLQIYSGNCCAFSVPKAGLYGTQRVRQVSTETEQKPFNIYFQHGVFFPDASEKLGARPLLEYVSYRFSGYVSDGVSSYLNYDNIVPVAAVTKKVGKGCLVLSGVHPEIDIDVVQKFDAPAYSVQERAKIDAITSMYGSESAQTETMVDYLKILSIATKKV